MKRDKLTRLIQQKYGDMPDVVAHLAQSHGQEQTARILSNQTGERIGQSDVSRYLRARYRCVVEVRYVPIEQEGEPS